MLACLIHPITALHAIDHQFNVRRKEEIPRRLKVQAIAIGHTRFKSVDVVGDFPSQNISEFTSLPSLPVQNSH